ncbi:glutamate--tRNA ligase [Agaricicola taiwanensis]|uniref:Glutamate--tRNA ligase n=1 Tax=Agaricicola taiwanensis TaxID=591372 RepID=A0A8J2VPC3_9RHOB|nr:glutamate--tRNA ligase [Agaricicola taiwanensis]GGE37600.1 glutamate--tRNA ligase [Agaricicola taiwanensis]
MAPSPVVRFAPSPTGLIHLGNVRTALLNWCLAKKAGGRFILRFDDTDGERSRDEYAEAIAADLRWLGMIPDETVRQSDRGLMYGAAAAVLKTAGRLYPAYETEEELDRKRRLARASGRPPIYDRAALKLSEEERARLEAEGRRPHWRFLLNHKPVVWDDLVRGNHSIDAASLSDPVLVREDGTPLYTFTSVVDDADLGITHIIRGEDHVTNTAVQIQLFEALGADAPAFAHHNLLIAASGAGLSKREGSLSIASLRGAGIEPQALAAYATLVGSAEAVRPVRDLAELAELVDLARLSRAPSHVDEAELAALNAKVVHGLSYDDVAQRLHGLGIGGGAAFWETVRPNLSRVDEAAEWWRIATGDLEPVAVEGTDADVIIAARHSLPGGVWDDTTWKFWTRAVAEATGLKGRALFHPLRKALTGRDAGPDMSAFLPFIGRERAQVRLGRSET